MEMTNASYVENVIKHGNGLCPYCDERELVWETDLKNLTYFWTDDDPTELNIVVRCGGCGGLHDAVFKLQGWVPDAY